MATRMAEPLSGDRPDHGRVPDQARLPARPRRPDLHPRSTRRSLQGETLAQAEFLLLLAQADDRDQISLSRAAGVDKSTTAFILDNLAATA